MSTFKFELNSMVYVQPHGRDQGGIGTITGREVKEDERGVEVLYRVQIPGHDLQGFKGSNKERVNRGFWYTDRLVCLPEDKDKILSYGKTKLEK